MPVCCASSSRFKPLSLRNSQRRSCMVVALSIHLQDADRLERHRALQGHRRWWCRAAGNWLPTAQRTRRPRPTPAPSPTRARPNPPRTSPRPSLPRATPAATAQPAKAQPAPAKAVVKPAAPVAGNTKILPKTGLQTGTPGGLCRHAGGGPGGCGGLAGHSAQKN